MSLCIIKIVLFPAVYYRVYTADGAIMSENKMADSSDSSLGRVNTVLFAPPHTVSSIKRCLCHLENIGDYENTCLFIAASCRSAMDNTDKVSILSHSGPGAIPQEPMALVVKLPNPERLFYNGKVVRGSSAYDAESIEPRFRAYSLT